MYKCNNCFHKKVCIYGANYKTAESCKHYVPTADVQEVRRGHWITTDDGTYECSNCNYQFEHEGYKHFFNFCPSCGAKMEDSNNE